MLDTEVRVLIGWYSLASQSERVPTRCFYVKVAYLSYGEYSNRKPWQFYTKKTKCTTNCIPLITEYDANKVQEHNMDPNVF